MNTHYNKIQVLNSVALCLLLVAGLNRCTSQGKPEEKRPKGDSLNGAGLITVERGILTPSLTMPGELISFQQVDLYAREPSFVKNIQVDVGSEVTTGQLLATLEAPEITSRLNGAESRWKSWEAIYTASKASYARIIETSKTPGTISLNDIDQALAKMNSDQAQLESAKAAYKEISNTIDYLSIRAPFSGVISARNVNPGAYVGPTGKGSDQPLFTLQEQKHLRLVVSVPEAYSAYLKHGDQVTFRIKAFPNEFFKARITRMAGALDIRLRSQRVEMDVINNDRKLLPGMVAQVTLSLINRDSAFIVPKSAIVNSPERVFVIRIVSGKVEWVDIQMGHSANGKTEIFGNLKRGDRIVRTATDEIRNGSLLKN
jgi:membrane fusion protein (multidrug efflux system)